jgi:gamma-glutamylcysteine synthetase
VLSSSTSNFAHAQTLSRTSNQGRMKTVYRHGLANRYGSVMQTIAGIHFNYSFAQDFLEQYHLLKAPSEYLPAKNFGPLANDDINIVVF